MSEERALGSWRQNQLKVILGAAIGIVLFASTISRVGPAALVEQLPAVGPVLVLALVLAAFRFSLQALGWRLAMPPDHRPPIVRSLLAVIGGEAAGYLTWGPVTREPVKAILMSGDVPARMSLAAAIAERVLYTVAAAGLVTAGLIILAVRTNHSAFVVPGLVTVIVAGVVIMRWRRFHVTYTMIGLAALQEITNVFETVHDFQLAGCNAHARDGNHVRGSQQAAELRRRIRAGETRRVRAGGCQSRGCHESRDSSRVDAGAHCVG